MKGKLIVIEGLDGSGKATQAQLLFAELLNRGKKVRKISFPNYESDSSALVKMYLRGDFGKNPGDVNAYAASSFFAVDRYSGYKKDWGTFYNEGGILIADRYTTSNAVHQCSKLPDDKWDAYLHWLFNYEYNLLGIPEPDMVIYLQTDTSISQELMNNRYQGDIAKKDIHESNIEYLNRSKIAAEYCRKAFNWETVSCIENGEMRSIRDIHNDIINLIPVM